MLRKIALVSCAALLSAGVAFAQTCPAAKDAAAAAKDGQKSCSASCGEGKACCQDNAKASGCCSSSQLASLKDMPQLLMKVGNETTPCCDKAKELAKGDESKIQFVVADKTFGNKCEAHKAYAAALDEYFNRLTTVQFAVGDKTMSCPTSADQAAKVSHEKVRYVLASHRFDEQAKADQIAKDARAAADKVAMKWAVGDKQFCCDKMAGAEAAKCKDAKVEYVVGDSRFSDEMQAKVHVARARVLAAAEVIEKAGA